MVVADNAHGVHFLDLSDPAIVTDADNAEFLREVFRRTLRQACLALALPVGATRRLLGTAVPAAARALEGMESESLVSV